MLDILQFMIVCFWGYKLGAIAITRGSVMADAFLNFIVSRVDGNKSKRTP